MVRKLIVASAILLVMLTAGAAIAVGPYYVRVQHHEATPERGYHADFYLYVPPAVRKAALGGDPVVVLVQPNNSGTNSDDPEVHRKDAWWMGFGRHGLADDLGVALLVPAFLRPAKDWHIYTHALDRDVMTTDRTDLARLDLQLLAMVDYARASLAAEGLQTDEQFLLQGYSASGMFANRFAALHPARVMAVAAGSPGGWPIAPIASHQGEILPYPAGVADLEALTGQPFDSTTYQTVPQLIVMGSLDGNDALDFNDGWERDEASRIDSLFGTDPLARWTDAESAYRAAGANAEFLLVDGVGHDRRALQPHSTAFLAKVLARERR